MSYMPKISGIICMLAGLIILFNSSLGFRFYIESIWDILALPLVLIGAFFAIFFKK